MAIVGAGGAVPAGRALRGGADLVRVRTKTISTRHRRTWLFALSAALSMLRVMRATAKRFSRGPVRQDLFPESVARGGGGS